MKNNNGKSKTQINNNVNSKDKQKKQTFITDFTNKENVMDINTKIIEDSSGNNLTYKKITKHMELLNFDTKSHIEQNITQFDSNCKDIISPQSYYCISCKKSFCTDCGLFEHKDHILVQREKALFYDANFFNDILKIINMSTQIINKKNILKDSLNNSIESLKKNLDSLKIKKFNEIEDFFDGNEKNLKNLNINFLEAKNKLEKYYKENKKFFNLNYKTGKNKDKLTGSENNVDNENIIFLINFDLLNLFDNKNLKVFDKINELINKVDTINESIQKATKDLTQLINDAYNLDLIFEDYEDYYAENKIIINKYSKFINKFQNIVSDMVKKNGNAKKMEELLGIFDSKNKKNKDIIFHQSFFNNEDNYTNNSKGRNSINPKIQTNANNTLEAREKNNLKVNIRLNYKRGSKNNNLHISNSKSAKKLIYHSFFEKENNLNLDNEETQLSKFHFTFYKYLFENKDKSTKNKNNLSTRSLSNYKLKVQKIILDNRLFQRFYAYSMYEFYLKNIINNDKKDKEKKDIFQKERQEIKIEEKKDSNMLTTSIKISESSLKKDNSIESKKLSPKNSSKPQIKTKTKSKTKQKENKIDLNQFGNKSISFLSYYQNRVSSFKDGVKPIIGTNQIQIFDTITKKIVKRNTNLNKGIHGYSTFPDGIRHILIDSVLYLTGGNNFCGNVVLSYNLLTNQLTRLPNLLYPHSFHSLEYINNFDCIVCLGGENSSVCEIMDLNDKKWKKLPSLNFPRANVNIYYNNITEQIYALFGMKGTFSDNSTQNLDKIEVLNLNKIDKGWINVDYYKSGGLDLKFSTCKILPFTKDKLIIFGGNAMRNLELKNFYAIFDMNKNEILKVDKETIELIKFQEKKMNKEEIYWKK